MTQRPSAADFNRLFRGSTYGRAPIFTAHSFAAFVRANDIDLSRSLCAFDEGDLVGALALGIRADRAWFGLIGVREDRRRGGIGRTIFERACEQVRAAGVRTIELETVQRNRAAIAMVAAYGFLPAGELLVWSRKAIRTRGSVPVSHVFDEADVTRRAIASPACWQREPRSISRSGPLSLIETNGGFAYVRVRGEFATIADMQAVDTQRAHGLLDRVDTIVPHDLTLNNEPVDSPLARALSERGWRVVERQVRIAGR